MKTGKINQYPAKIYPTPKHPAEMMRDIVRIIERICMDFFLDVSFMDHLSSSILNQGFKGLIYLPIDDLYTQFHQAFELDDAFHTGGAESQGVCIGRWS
jgi:hypothetical protein